MATTGEVARKLNVTFRQLDYWVRQGWVSPETEGSSNRSIRYWSKADIEKVTLMARMVHAGIDSAKAAKVATVLMANPSDKTRRSIKVGPGVYIVIESDVAK